MKTQSKWIPLVGLLAVLAGSPVRAELREFTDVKGRTISAEFLGFQDAENVNLRMATGKMVTVALARLSKADQDYIAEHPAAKLTPLKLPKVPLFVVKDWNEQLGRQETYFINSKGQRAFRRPLSEIYGNGFIDVLGEYAIVKGAYYGVLDTAGSAQFGVSRVGPDKLEPGATDAPIFLGRYGTGDAAYVQYLRKDGKPFIAARFADARPFNSERAWVNLEAGDKPKPGHKGIWTLVDYRGNLLHAFDSLEVQDFSEGRAGVALDVNSTQWSIIDTDAKVIAKGPFRRVGRFINGAAVVDGRLMDRDGNWLLEEKGECSIDSRYENSQSDAVVARRARRVAGATRYGILRRSTGEFIADIPDDYYLDRGFFNGLAMIRDAKLQKYGYISRTGELAIKPEFSGAEAFQGGFANVKVGETRDPAVINLAGEVIWKAKVPKVAEPPAEEKIE